MCTYNTNTSVMKIVMKAISDAAFRERFLADPDGTAREAGFSEADQKELAAYNPRKLRRMVEGPNPDA